MPSFHYTHLNDKALLGELAARLAQDRASTADLVALIAEVDTRRLYVPAGYSSMHAFCVQELRLSDDEAYKRITAARTARRFPLLFTELAEGRLHLTAICTLAPHLTEENLRELVKEVTHRRRAEIEDFLQLRFASRSAHPIAPASGSQPFFPSELAPERAGVQPDSSPPGDVELETLRHAQPPTRRSRCFLQRRYRPKRRHSLRSESKRRKCVPHNGRWSV